MKTPLQEHIEWLKEKHKTVINHPYVEIADCIEHAESMLHNEEAMIKYSYWEGVINRADDVFQENDWYNKKFNQKNANK